MTPTKCVLKRCQRFSIGRRERGPGSEAGSTSLLRRAPRFKRMPGVSGWKVPYVRSNWAREATIVARVLGHVVLVLRLANATGRTSEPCCDLFRRQACLTEVRSQAAGQARPPASVELRHQLELLGEERIPEVPPRVAVLHRVS